MLTCSVIVWLALLALLLAVIVLWANRVLTAPWLESLAKRVCPNLCRLAVVLAFLAGFALAWWLHACGPSVWRALAAAEPCVRWIVMLLVLLVIVLTWLALALAACRSRDPKPPGPVIERISNPSLRTAAQWSVPVLLALAIALIILLALRCCAEPLRSLLYGDACVRLLGWVLLLYLIALLIGMVALRYCRTPDQSICRRIAWFLWFALALALLILILLIRCCGHLGNKDYDLAMVGIWWEGGFPEEKGAHLRWAFRFGLEFPAGGFDLYRRESSGGVWSKLNAQPIRPVNVFSDANPAPGPMWQPRAVDRLHPDRWSHFQGTAYAELQDMLGRPAYTTLFYVQEPDDPALPQPTSPYVSQAALDAYLQAYYAADSPAHPATPLAQWQVKPMEALMIAGVDPEIGRLLGLLYIDKTADPAIEYDYRVVGHWPDMDRSWTVEKLSKPNTQPLAAPVLTHASNPVSYPTPGGGTVTADRVVGIRWEPPVLNPAAPIPSSAGIVPIRVLPKRKDLGMRPCPAAAPPDPSFAVILRPGEGETPEPVAAVVAVPEETPTGPVWPQFFFLDRFVDYRCYGYGLEGIDLFGRTSVLSNTLVADVVDISGPPPPLNVSAVVYQRADTAGLAALDPVLRSRLFPASASHSSALYVSWVWPNALLASVPDLDHFLVYLKVDDYATFSQPANASLWPEPTNWAPFVPVPVPATAGGALPPSLVDAGVADAQYFDAVIFAPPLAPDDDNPVVYGYAGVGGVDRAPFGNAGKVSPPVVIFARDFEPPAPPPIPAIDKFPEPTDKGANASLALSWDADARYLYHLVRARGSELEPLSLPSTVPACLAPELPTCTDTGPDCVEEKRRFQLRRKAVAHLERYKLANLEPAAGVPVGVGFRFRGPDKVDASEGDDYLYAGRAIDRAGNVSAIGCPQLVRVRDFLPPRAPTVRSIVGGEGEIRIEWAVNPEADLDGYRLLRTASADNDGSLDRMPLVLDIDRNGAVRAPAGAPAPTFVGAGTAYRSIRWRDGQVRPVTDYRYRIVAIDRSGNVSELSAAARGRAFDTTPPLAPLWGAVPVAVESSGGVDVVRLRFGPPPGDADATFRVQRQETGKPAWRPIAAWLPAGSTEFVDENVRAGADYAYRIQAMDVAGNVGPSGTVQSTP